LFFLYPALLDLKNRLPIFFSGKHQKFRERLFKFLETTIECHRKTAQIGQPRDYIDAYLEESSRIDGFGEVDLYVTLLDLFVTGSETVSTTLKWTFFLLAQHPEVQEKVVDEISTVVGSREVALSDKLSLPYVEATTLEIMRISHLAPMGVPHSLNQDFVYKGFSFPKNAIVIANLYACHMSPDTWGDPWRFRPERFLSPDGKSIVRNKALIPFGTGKRSCIGESLARDEVFLFLTNVFKTICITMPSDEPAHTLEGCPIEFANAPTRHRIVARVRSEAHSI
jgi:cytochrome P450